MITKEFKLCKKKGKYVTILHPITIIRTLRTKRSLSIANFSNALTVFSECLRGNSSSWLMNANFRTKPIAETVPITKRQPSIETIKLMVEGYQNSADDDLALAKEFEGIEPIIDDECH